MNIYGTSCYHFTAPVPVSWNTLPPSL